MDSLTYVWRVENVDIFHGYKDKYVAALDGSGVGLRLAKCLNCLIYISIM